MERLFNMADARLLELAQQFNSHFTSHIDAFQSIDSSLSVDWFSELYGKARRGSRDRFERGVLRRQTLQVMELMEACRPAYLQAKYFIMKAFKKDTKSIAYFDLAGFQKYRRSQANLIIYMDLFAKRVENHRDELTAAGASEGLFTLLRDLADQLDAANAAQELSKSQRKSLTQLRLENMNALYQAMRRVHDVAKFAFADDLKVRALFTLPSRSAGSAETEEAPPTAGEGQVAAGDGAPMTGGLDAAPDALQQAV